MPPPAGARCWSSSSLSGSKRGCCCRGRRLCRRDGGCQQRGRWQRQQCRAAQRRGEQLVQKLLSERNASSGAAVAPTGTRTAWEDRIDRHATQLQEELGLGKDRAAASTTRQQRSASADAYERSCARAGGSRGGRIGPGRSWRRRARRHRPAGGRRARSSRRARRVGPRLSPRGGGEMFPGPRTSTQQHADADVDPRGKGAAIPMSASAIPRTSPPYASAPRPLRRAARPAARRAGVNRRRRR